MLAVAVPAHAGSTTEASRLKAQKAGEDFEGILLNMVMGAVERSFSELPGTKLQQETEAYNGLGMQALTSGLARAGGIGLGKLIAAALMRTENGHQPHESTPGPKLLKGFSFLPITELQGKGAGEQATTSPPKQ